MAKCFTLWSSDGRRVAVLGVVLVVYLFVGAAVFVALEKDHEADLKNELRSLIEQFLNETGIPAYRLRNFTERYNELSSKGATLNVNNWEFGPSVFFALTVVTTIGYGTVAPVTQGGQAFCVVYALFGIPLVGVLLTQLANLLTAVCTVRLEQLHEHCRHRQCFRSLSITVAIALIGSVVFLIIPAVIFRRIEGWSFGEGFYCAFITLTTIGFGDFVPGQQVNTLRSFYKMMTVLWILFGLVFLAVIIEALSRRLKRSLNKFNMKVNDFAGKRLGLKPADVEMTSE